MTDLIASALKNSLGLQLLHWAVSQSDIWHLAHRCSELAQKINEPLKKSAYVLDNLLTMDEDDIDCIGIRDFHLQQMHFDDEDDYNDQEQSQRNYRNQQRTNTSLTWRSNGHAGDSPGKKQKYIFISYHIKSTHINCVLSYNLCRPPAGWFYYTKW